MTLHDERHRDIPSYVRLSSLTPSYVRLSSLTLPCVFILALFAGSFLHVSDLQADDVTWGSIKANKILFLGNSITLHPPRNDSGVYWPNNWGMAASSQDKDYVHLLAGKIDAATGGSLRIAPTERPADYGDPVVLGDANVVNIAGIFERNYAAFQTSDLQQQIAAQPDIVVLQFGENMGGLPDSNAAAAFKAGLATLLTGLKNSSNPEIFVTSFILGSNSQIDAIKQELCAEDPTHRTFVSLTGIVDASGAYGHPNDAGMATIANTLFTAMEGQAAAVPEPTSLSLLLVAGPLLAGAAWLRHRIKT